MQSMDLVRISDCTLAGPEDQISLSFREKIEFCKMVNKLNVSVIQLSPIRQKKIDSLLIKSVVSAVKNVTVAVPVGLTPESVQETWDTLRQAASARLQVAVPVSSVQMEYLLHMKPAAVLKAASDAIRECRKWTENVEFIAEDATRSDHDFLCGILQEAVKAGAGTITLSDRAGEMLPDEVASFLDRLAADVPELKEVTLGFGFSNNLALADACAVAAVRHGAREIKAVACRSDAVSLANICRVIHMKGAEFGVRTSVNTEQIRRVVNQMDMFFSGKGSIAGSAGDSAADTAGGLYASDSRETLLSAVERLGYDLNPEDQEKVWNSFCHIAAKKNMISLRELDAIIAAEAMQVPSAYHDVRYTVNTDYSIGAMAHMKISLHDKELEGVSAGDGAVDAAFLAIEKAIGKHFELDDFQIQAITEGREAMGETIVKLRSNGKLYSGRGLSTDIIGSSIMAYINALNKITFEEENA